MVLEGRPDWAPEENGGVQPPATKRILSDETLFEGSAATGLPAEQPPPAAVPVYPVALDEREPSTMIIQVAIVALASVAVGLLVFTGIRSAFNTDDSAALDNDGDVSTNVFRDEGVESEDNLTGSNQRFGTAQMDGESLIGPDESLPVPTTLGQSVVPLGPRASSPAAPLGSDDPTGDGTAASSPSTSTASSSTTRATIVPSTTIDLITTLVATPTTRATTTILPVSSSITSGPVTIPISVTTTRPTTAPTTAAPSTASTTRPTTAPTTTTPTTVSTTQPTTVSTSTSTTSTTVAPVEVNILAPGITSALPWSSPVAFEASVVDGADSYCWSFSVVGVTPTASPTVSCAGAASSEVTLKDLGLEPGRLTIELTARDDEGDPLATDTRSVWVRATDVIVSPGSGTSVALDEALVVESVSLSNADDYCWTLRQAGTNGGADLVSTPSCTSLSQRQFTEFHSLRQGIVAGPATLELEVRNSSGILATSEVDLVFAERETSNVVAQDGTPTE